jgi:hypothetical protein
MLSVTSPPRYLSLILSSMAYFAFAFEHAH